jgi:GTPase SAR1 family protein
MIIEIEKVFTPGSSAELTYISRNTPEKQIKRALKNKGIQIVVYGNTGSGKTTLLYNLLNDTKTPKFITRCTKGNSIKDVLYDGFSQLGTFYTTQESFSTEEKMNVGIKFGMDFFSFGANSETKEAQNKISSRIVEIQKNPNLLAKLFGAAGYLWVIEDFHKLESGPKKELSQIMKVFMDVAMEFPKAKIIAIGAVNSARQVVDLDNEMENRVSEVNVPLMTPKQLQEIISLGEVHLNITIDNDVQDKIVAYSSGLASVTHLLCSLACESKNITETQTKNVVITNDDLDYAVNEYVNEKSDSLKSIYEQAIKEKKKRLHESPEKILKAILELEKDTFSIVDISQKFSEQISNYKTNNLRKYVMQLTTSERGEILRYNKNADNFSFSNPFLRGYCHIHLIKYSTQTTKPKIHKEHQNSDLIKEYLSAEFQKFLTNYNDYSNENDDIDEF